MTTMIFETFWTHCLKLSWFILYHFIILKACFHLKFIITFRTFPYSKFLFVADKTKYFIKLYFESFRFIITFITLLIMFWILFFFFIKHQPSIFSIVLKLFLLFWFRLLLILIILTLILIKTNILLITKMCFFSKLLTFFTIIEWNWKVILFTKKKNSTK